MDTYPFFNKISKIEQEIQGDYDAIKADNLYKILFEIKKNRGTHHNNSQTLDKVANLILLISKKHPVLNINNSDNGKQKQFSSYPINSQNKRYQLLENIVVGTIFKVEILDLLRDGRIFSIPLKYGRIFQDRDLGAGDLEIGGYAKIVHINQYKPKFSYAKCIFTKKRVLEIKKNTLDLENITKELSKLVPDMWKPKTGCNVTPEVVYKDGKVQDIIKDSIPEQEELSKDFMNFDKVFGDYNYLHFRSQRKDLIPEQDEFNKSFNKLKEIFTDYSYLYAINVFQNKFYNILSEMKEPVDNFYIKANVLMNESKDLNVCNAKEYSHALEVSSKMQTFYDKIEEMYFLFHRKEDESTRLDSLFFGVPPRLNLKYQNVISETIEKFDHIKNQSLPISVILEDVYVSKSDLDDRIEFYKKISQQENPPETQHIEQNKTN